MYSNAFGICGSAELSDVSFTSSVIVQHAIHINIDRKSWITVTSVQSNDETHSKKKSEKDSCDSSNALSSSVMVQHIE